MALPGNLQAQRKEQPYADCSVAHGGWPRGEHNWWLILACTTGKLQSLCTQWSATDHAGAPPPFPCTQTLHRVRRLVVTRHSQSLQLTGLVKSLPLTCQRQSRLNFRSRAYSVHTEGTPRVPSLGDRGGCATGPYYIMPHYQDRDIAALPNT